MEPIEHQRPEQKHNSRCCLPNQSRIVRSKLIS